MERGILTQRRGDAEKAKRILRDTVPQAGHQVRIKKGGEPRTDADGLGVAEPNPNGFNRKDLKEHKEGS
jgi:hypothetical protein